MISNKFCLITGASQGLGKYLAEYFWDNGWSIILVARNKKALENLVSSLPGKNGQDAHIIVSNLEYPNEILSIYETTKTITKKLDTLINNAAIQGPIGPFWENEWAEWGNTLKINLYAPIKLCHLFSSWMIKMKYGSIINLSGGGGTMPRPNFSAYSTAKAGLIRFSENLAEELKPYGIRVNCIAPGAMRTNMTEAILKHGETLAGEKEYKAAYRVLKNGGSSMKRVAQLCHFLASEKSQGITGKLISALWDNWEEWPLHLDELSESDVYTLRRITGRDRGILWGDK
jgi:3-oxoacyl-[acyl-carrier protein] reductase